MPAAEEDVATTHFVELLVLISYFVWIFSVVNPKKGPNLVSFIQTPMAILYRI